MSSTRTREAYVYVLSLTLVNHSSNYKPEHEIVGVYSSKAAAAFAAGSVRTTYGNFEDAIEEMFQDAHIDNRENPPDNGVLIQIGREEVGEGDYVMLNIEKFELKKDEGNTTNLAHRSIFGAAQQRQQQPQITIAALLTECYKQQKRLQTMQSLLQQQQLQPIQSLINQPMLRPFGQHMTPLSHLGLLQNTNRISASTVESLSTDPQSHLLESVIGLTTQSVDRVFGAGAMHPEQEIPRALAREQELTQALVQSKTNQINHLGTSYPQGQPPQLHTNHFKPSTDLLASTSDMSSSSVKSKKNKAKKTAISAPNASKKQRLETQEKLMEMDEASLMMIMKGIMDPAEYTRVNEEIQRMAEKLEYEAAPLREATNHIFSMDAQPENLFKVHVGDFWGMFDTRNYMRARLELANTIQEEIASVYGTPESWEAVLWHYQEMLRLCSSDNLGLRYSFPFLLVRLDRDDDAFCFIRHWVNDDRNAKLHKASKEGDWLYGHKKDCRYLDIFLLVSAEKFQYCGLAFLVALACIKMRIIAEEYSSKAQQRTQLDRIIGLIDRLNPTMLPALLNPGPLLSKPEPEYSPQGSPSECYTIVKDASPIWHAIPGALKVLQDQLGKKPTYNCNMRI